MGAHLRVFSIQHYLYGFQNSLRPCALDERSLNIGRVDRKLYQICKKI